jgi:hypothetical protein
MELASKLVFDKQIAEHNFFWEGGVAMEIVMHLKVM